VLVEVAHRNAGVGLLVTGEAGLDGAEVELDFLGELRIVLAEETLRLEILLGQFDVVVVAAGQLEVVERRVVDREHADRRSLLGAMLAIVARSATESWETPGP